MPSPYTEDGRLVLQFVESGTVVTADEDSILIPFWYYTRLFEYIVDTQTAFQILSADRELN